MICTPVCYYGYRKETKIFEQDGLTLWMVLVLLLLINIIENFISLLYISFMMWEEYNNCFRNCGLYDFALLQLVSACTFLLIYYCPYSS